MEFGKVMVGHYKRTLPLPTYAHTKIILNMYRSKLCGYFPDECDYWQIKCPSNGICLDQRVRCDGTPHCEDGADEIGCDVLRAEEEEEPVTTPAEPAEETNSTTVRPETPSDWRSDCPVTCDGGREDVSYKVCTTGGITYPSECHVKLENCQVCESHT